MPRIRTERVCGPYYDSSRRKPWAVHNIQTNGRRHVARFESEAAALEFIKESRQEAQGRTVTAAVEAYLEHKRTKVGEGTVTTLGYRLHGLLRTGERDRLLRDLKPAIAERLYTKRVDETKADTHRGELAAAKAWATWCIKKRGWIRVNPFADVEPVGKLSRGKPQLRVDAARQLLDVAEREDTAGNLSVRCGLEMGLSASEIADRNVRDLDDGGRLLWIEDGKTRNRDAHIIVPEGLRAPLLSLAAGRDATDPLFGCMEPRLGVQRRVDRHWVLRQVHRVCAAAGVDEVTSHSLRGLFATVGASDGLDVGEVGRRLRHGDKGSTARKHYIKPGTIEAVERDRAWSVIQGGRR